MSRFLLLREKQEPLVSEMCLITSEYGIIRNDNGTQGSIQKFWFGGEVLTHACTLHIFGSFM